VASANDTPLTVLTPLARLDKSWSMENKVVLITGASSGFGLACANHLNAKDWKVIGASRRVLSPTPWNALAMDVDDDASVTSGVAKIVGEYGQLDAVIANAGWGLAGAVERTPIDEAKAQLETNFFGVIRVVKAALPTMRERGGGHVVIMSSIGGVIGIPFQAFYCASKFALEGYAEALAYEVAPFNIQVTLVQPGNFKTGFTTARRKTPIEAHSPYAEAEAKAIALMEKDEEKGADPRDAARAIEKILNNPHPPRRISVGKWDERIGVVGKRVIPFRLFERAARSSLGV
jgi:NAD(P)-dependent dehydrogenase (short-subunit alcohol dehydrogenase family)